MKYEKKLHKKILLLLRVCAEFKNSLFDCHYRFLTTMVHGSWLAFATFIVLHFSIRSTVGAEQPSSLKQLHVIFRHGERTPADTYPNDPYINYSFEPFGWGQLTNKGKLDQFEQGEFLRHRYDTFLGDIYSPDTIKAYSTDSDRTKMSVMLELAGLFPPSPAQKWHPSLNWQPIPVHNEPLHQDSLLLVRVSCPKYHYELENLMKSAEIQHILENKYGASSLYSELTAKTGMTIKSPDDVQSLYSTLKAEESFNLSLPEWTKKYYPDKLVPLTEYSFVLNAYNDQLQKLKGGPLLKKILKDSRGKIAGNVKQKIFVYGGHDSTISNLLLALKVWEPQIPGYGILIIIELREENGVNGFKIYLRNSTITEPYALSMPGCNHFCPMTTFEALTANVIPNDDFEKECSIEDSTYVPPTAGPI